MYYRQLAATIQDYVNTSNQALILTGPRQVGKTTLLKSLFPQAKYLNLDDLPTETILESYSLATYKSYLPDRGIVILDEIQHLSDPGRAGKLIIDNFPDLKLIITGSAGLSIKNKHTESMAGRAHSIELFPLSLTEYLVQTQAIDSSSVLPLQRIINPSKSPDPGPRIIIDKSSLIERLLIYGLYPNLINHPNPKIYLKDLVERIIFKDLLDLSLISEKKLAFSILTIIAYQIGQLLSYQEVANKLDIDVRTVKKYLDLFEEAYLIFRLYPYSKNGRNVLTKRPKIYFLDTGIRNALINLFQPLNLRNDAGQLFENFIIIETLKYLKYHPSDQKMFYWRTKQGSEIDLVLSTSTTLRGVEIKLNPRAPNQAFANHYPQASLETISLENIL